MGSLFNACTQGEGKKGIKSSVAANGICKGGLQAVDEAAMEAINNGIDGARHNELK